jgi:hypothetical protein
MSSHRRSHGSLTDLIYRIEKEQQKRRREAEKWRLKRQAQEDASQAVNEEEQLLQHLTSMHENDPIHVDWCEINESTAPIEPVYSSSEEDAAKIRFLEFKPSWLHKLFGYKRRLKGLERQIPKAAARDEKRHAEVMLEYGKQHKTWQTLQRISNGVIDHEPSAYKEAMDYFQLFVEADYFGSAISFSLNKEISTIDLHVHDIDIIPNYIFSQTAAGKLSKKNMPQSKRNKYYQEHVCSALLKVARDMLGLLPLSSVLINAMSRRLNSVTGRIEDQVLLSVLFDHAILEELNFTGVDPADAMGNFMHNMKFTNAGGFGAVEKINIDRIRQQGLGKGRN